MEQNRLERNRLESALGETSSAALPAAFLVVIVASTIGSAYWMWLGEARLAWVCFANTAVFAYLTWLSQKSDGLSVNLMVTISTLSLYACAIVVTVRFSSTLYHVLFPAAALGPSILATRLTVVVVLSLVGAVLSTLILVGNGIEQIDQRAIFVVGVMWTIGPVLWVTRVKAVDAHERIAEAKRQASLKQLCAGVAHSFNNIIQSILSAAEVSRSKRPEVADDWDTIIVSAESGAILGKTMGLYAGANFVTKRTIPITEFAYDLERLCTAGPDWVYTELLLPEADLYIDAEKELLSVCISSIVRNSVEAVEALARPFVCVRLTCGEGKLYVYVVDNGPGITPENRARVFDPFFSTKGLGRGLGLSFALGVIDRHNGSIELESLANGTEVRVTIPMIKIA